MITLYLASLLLLVDLKASSFYPQLALCKAKGAARIVVEWVDPCFMSKSAQFGGEDY